MCLARIENGNSTILCTCVKTYVKYTGRFCFCQQLVLHQKAGTIQSAINMVEMRFALAGDCVQVHPKG